jgi:pilus assembly protein CpaE
MRSPEILVLASDRSRAAAFAQRIATGLPNPVREFDHAGGGLEEAIHASRPAALVALVSESGDSVFPALSALGEGRPPLLVCGPSDDAALVLRAMRLGAVEFVGSEEGFSAVESALRGLLDAGPASARPSGGQLIGVLGAKGGVGTTSVAAQLAVSIQALAGRTALFDLAQAPGDVSLQLDLTTACGLARAAQETETLDATFLRSMLTRHASGVEVLVATERSEDAERLAGPTVERALGLLGAEFDWVVVDLGRGWSDGSVRALDALSQLLLVTQAEVPCLVNAQRQLDLLAGLGVPPEQIHLVENRQGRDDAIPERDLRRFLGRAVAAKIPEDAAVVRCANEGKTLAEGAPYGEAQRAVVGLARQVLAWCGRTEQSPARAGLLQRVRFGLSRRGRGAA